MLAVCSASQVAYCSISVEGKVSVVSKAQLPQPPLCEAAAWDAVGTSLLLPTQTSLLSLDPTSKKPISTLKTWKSAPIQTLAISGLKNNLYYCQNNKLVCVEPRGQPRAIIQGGCCANVRALQVSKDQNLVVCLGSIFYCVDVSAKSHMELEGIHNEGVGAFCFSNHQSDRLYATDRGDLLLYDLKVSPFPSKRVAVGDTRMVAIKSSPSHPHRLALADSKCRIFLVDTQSDTPISKKFTLISSIASLSWSSSGKSLLIGSSDGKLISIDVNGTIGEPEYLVVDELEQPLTSVFSIPIKFKPVSPKPVRTASATQTKRPPLTDGSNIIRSVSSPNIKSNSGKNVKSPKQKISSLRPRISEPNKPTPRKVSVSSKPKNAMAVPRSPRQEEPLTPSRRKTRVSSSSSSRTLSTVASLPSTLGVNPPQGPPEATPSVASSSSSPNLSSGTSRTNDSDTCPSTPSTVPENLHASEEETTSISPSLPSLTMDATITLTNPVSEEARSPLPTNKPMKPRTAPYIRPKSSVTFDALPVLNNRIPSEASRQPSRIERTSSLQSIRSSREPRVLESLPEDDIKELLGLMREETRESILNVHLDLVRMNRAWQSQIQSTFQECFTEWQGLKEENARLKAENAWLRSM